MKPKETENNKDDFLPWLIKRIEKKGYTLENAPDYMSKAYKANNPNLLAPPVYEEWRNYKDDITPPTPKNLDSTQKDYAEKVWEESIKENNDSYSGTETNSNSKESKKNIFIRIFDSIICILRVIYTIIKMGIIDNLRYLIFSSRNGLGISNELIKNPDKYRRLVPYEYHEGIPGNIRERIINNNNQADNWWKDDDLFTKEEQKEVEQWRARCKDDSLCQEQRRIDLDALTKPYEVEAKNSKSTVSLGGQAIETPEGWDKDEYYRSQFNFFIFQCLLLQKCPYLTLPKDRNNVTWIKEEVGINDFQSFYPLLSCLPEEGSSFWGYGHQIEALVHKWPYGPNPIAYDYSNAPTDIKGEGTILYFISIDLEKVNAGKGKIFKVGITTKPLVVGLDHAARYGTRYAESIQVLRSISYKNESDAREKERQVINYKYLLTRAIPKEETNRYEDGKKLLSKTDFETLGPTEWVFPGASEKEAIELFNYITGNNPDSI